MSVFHGPPHQVSLEEYEELVAGGEPAQDAWLASTRKFLRHVRSFCLIKEGAERADSRAPAGLACDIRASLVTPIVAGQPIEIDAIVTNSGVSTWLASNTPRGGVALGSHLYDEASGALVTFDFHVEPLTDPPREIPPGETVRRRVPLPSIASGRYRLELDCVASHVTWFAQAGSKPATLLLEV